jgi:hypothetical protein
MTEHQDDLPWNDVPADSDVVPGTEEPDPAEVMGTEDDDAVRDAALPRFPTGEDEFRRESLAERLAEEEPDRVLDEDEQEPEAGELQAPEAGQDDVDVPLAEADREYAERPRDDEPAEEAAVRVVDDDRVM